MTSKGNIQSIIAWLFMAGFLALALWIMTAGWITGTMQTIGIVSIMLVFMGIAAFTIYRR